ncbi:hypothetical protein [Aquimonas voraii]|uniref:Lipoprotein n=1 Tax=Aquimonas voraii TaxID=265719 RepID=A0A1G6VZI2_9GAMM|nr:hypothetical protein [Aquimonas voraii]SDD58195.1 hypothetical protein SAMN04488509_1045 [Aquimonas voraii]
MNRVKFRFSKAGRIAGLASAIAACAVAQAGAPEADALPRGEYAGEIWSDGMYPSVTEFYGATRDGRDGVYRFEYGDDVEEGVLFDCKRLKAQEFRCGWKDRWGSGLVDMSFSADFKAFTGVWSNEDNPPSLGLRWHGRRQ